MLPPLFPSETAPISIEATPIDAIAPAMPNSDAKQALRAFSAVHASFWVTGAVVLTIFGLVSFLAMGIVTSSPSSASVHSGSVANISDFGSVYGAWTDLPPSLVNEESSVFEAVDLRAKLATILANYSDDEFGIVVAPAGDGDQVRIHDDRVFTGASTTKLLTAAAVLANVDNGKLRLDQTAYTIQPTPVPTEEEKKSVDPTPTGNPSTTPSVTPTAKPTPTPEPIPVTVQQALQSMVNRSNNTAWENLIRLVGSRQLKQFAADLGMQEYVVTDNSVSPRDMALLLHKLYSDQLLSQSSKELLLSYMQHTNEERMIPAGITQSGEVYHKYGWLGGSLHDVAVVDNLGSPVIVVLMSEGKSSYAERAQIIRELSETVEQSLIAGRD